MTATLPDIVPSGTDDTATLPVSARTQGDHGFVFFNNYLRHYSLPEHKGVQVALKLPSGTMVLPREPVNIPSQTAFFWPVNLNLDGALLKYATAQPFAIIADRKIRYFFFTAINGIAPGFVFAASTISSLESKTAEVVRTDKNKDERIYVTRVSPSTGVAMNIQTKAQKRICIVVLSPEQAQNSWKVSVNGHEHLLITSADVFFDGATLHLRSRDVNAFSFSILPEVAEPFTSAAPLRKDGADGAFIHYTALVEASQVPIGFEKRRDAGRSSPVKMGKIFDWRPNPVAEAPDDAEFKLAGEWHLTLPKDGWPGVDDLFLDIHYIGDVGRLYAGRTLLDDNFFNGTGWEIGLKRFSPEMLAEGLSLEILPLRKDAPIYMPKTSWPEFGGNSEVAEVKSVTVFPEYEVMLTIHRPDEH